MLLDRDAGEAISDHATRNVVILAALDDLTITWSRYSPGERGPGLHVHREHTDAFFVLEGELTFLLGCEEERVVVPAGGFVAAPPGVQHSFFNDGAGDARWLNFHAPDAGFAAYMRGARDGVKVAFDSFDSPAGGGLPAGAAIVSGPGAGERIARDGRDALLKCSREDMSVADWTIDGPFGGPDLHHHDDHVDAFFVIEGELEVTLGDEVRSAPRGSLWAAPRGVRHTFAHRGEGRARFVNVHAPDAGFADGLRGPARTTGAQPA